jgi:hypothetical protein
MVEVLLIFYLRCHGILSFDLGSRMRPTVIRQNLLGVRAVAVGTQSLYHSICIALSGTTSYFMNAPRRIIEVGGRRWRLMKKDW